MGFINKILPNKFKPLSRDIGFLSNAIIYKIKCIRRKTHSYPILILGNQKSGTSVISGLLGEISSKKTAIDLFYSGFKYSLFVKWKDKKISTKEFINKNKIEFAYEIIKEPHFSVFYQELKSQFPHSKFVMIIRNPFDNIRSILDRLDIDGNKENLEDSDKKKIFHSWNLVFDNHWIGGEKTQYIEVLSERWNIICNTYLENKKDMILIKYEDFLLNKEEIIKILSSKLKLDNNKEISHLLEKQFQIKGRKKDVDLTEFFGGENYQRIESICKENMKKLGY